MEDRREPEGAGETLVGRDRVFVFIVVTGPGTWSVLIKYKLPSFFFFLTLRLSIISGVLSTSYYLVET